MSALANVVHLPEQFDLSGYIKGHLTDSDEADPHVIAGELVDGMTPEQAHVALRAAMPSLVREALRIQRNQLRAPTPRSSRWDQVAAANADGSLDVMRLRLFVGEWKLLGDCTAEDLDAVVEMRTSEAAALAANAEKYTQLAKRVRRAKASTVAALDADVVRGILGV